MIRTYYLNVQKIDNTEVMDGLEYVHNALVDMEGELRRVIQDTTQDEHDALITIATKWRKSTAEEAKRFEDMKKEYGEFSVIPRDLGKEIDEIKSRLYVLEPKAIESIGR